MASKCLRTPGLDKLSWGFLFTWQITSNMLLVMQPSFFSLIFTFIIHKLWLYFDINFLRLQVKYEMQRILKIFVLLKWNKNQVYKRPNETWDNTSLTKINPKTQEKYPVSINILTSLRIFCIIILQHQVLLHIIAFKVSICSVLCIYQTKCCRITFLALPRLANKIFNRPVVDKTILTNHKSQHTFFMSELQLILKSISVSFIKYR